jgi:DMSO/TMAO reductase YedYZ heme-binding membrane subunit
MKKRAFEADEEQEARESRASSPSPSLATRPPERTEPTPRGRTAIALVLASWLVPLWMIVSLVRRSETEPGTQALHRVLTIASVLLLGAGMGLAIRAIDRARKDARIRRRLALAALLLSLLTPVVWMSELTLAFQLFVARERIDAASDASSPPSE